MSRAPRPNRAAIEQVRSNLIEHLQGVASEVMTAQAARVLLEQARAWSPHAARTLEAHIIGHPAAFTSGSPRCPPALPRLLQLLHAAGHGGVVVLIGCALCGRTDGVLRRTAPAGRCCSWCLARTRLRRCARCGRDGHLIARRAEGSICQRCYTGEPAFKQECAGCGRSRRVSVRRGDGGALCWACAPLPEHDCVRCGHRRQAKAITDAGPVCQPCYRAPARLCGVCGEVRVLRHRGGEGRPASCTTCYRNLGECVVCGRVRHGSKLRGEAFHCYSCRPRRLSRCAVCEQMKPVCAIWPLGRICPGCYQRRHHDPQPCARCGTTRVLIGRDPDGGGICGPCCGAKQSYDCQRCGAPGQLHSAGKCARCVARDRVHDLLSDDEGTVAAQLRPLAEALTAAQPWSTLSWLATSPAATLLAGLVAEQTEISHELLDRLAQNTNTNHIREVLVTTGILPRRQEHLAQLGLWIAATVKELAPHHRTIVLPFAEWQILRDARRRAAFGRYSYGAAAADRRDVQGAIRFLGWLDTTEITLGDLTQHHLEVWLDANPAQHRHTTEFLHWAVARRRTGRLDIPTRQNALPSRFLSERELHDQLRRCLNDDSLPLDVRIIGALVRLYALPLVRILELTVDQFHHADGRAYLRISQNAVLLPPRLAALIEEQIARPRHLSTLRLAPGAVPGYLLPGLPPSRPRNAGSVSSLMAEHDLPNSIARNTAMIEAVTQMPPIVVSDLFGIAPKTAHLWAQFAQDSWTDYLAATGDDAFA